MYKKENTTRLVLFQRCKFSLIFSIHHINKMKEEKNMVISIVAQKPFDKIQHPFMRRTQQTKTRR